SGLSALCAKKFLRNDGRIVSFDLKHWTTDSNTVLREEDFADERLFQLTDDLSNPLVFPLHLDLLRTAELIFVDAAKDGVSETRILEHLSTITFHTPPIVVLDDIRLWNMLRIWRDISRPKLDVTSFGHWSGTGLIEWR
ncbi:MAG: methyltransferase, partial [Deltaproteobacteria bacterium]|nr:methyltransferase [Deltaproteobacteria bacterium]